MTFVNHFRYLNLIGGKPYNKGGVYFYAKSRQETREKKK